MTWYLVGSFIGGGICAAVGFIAGFCVALLLLGGGPSGRGAGW